MIVATLLVSALLVTLNVTGVFHSLKSNVSTPAICELQPISTFNTTGVVVTSVTSTTIVYPKTASNVTSQAATGTVGVVKTTDTFANAFTNFFTGAYDDVTADVESIRIRRGRDDILSQINAGTCELEVRRPSDRSYWNPANKSSALNASNAPGFVPMRPIRITGTYGGTTYGLFWGFLRSAKFDYESGICRLSCVDLFVFLQRTVVLDPALSTTQGASTSLADSYTPDTGTASYVSSSVTTAKARTGFVRTAV